MHSASVRSQNLNASSPDLIYVNNTPSSVVLTASCCSIYSIDIGIGIGISIRISIGINNSTCAFLCISVSLGSITGMRPLFQVEVLLTVIICV